MQFIEIVVVPIIKVLITAFVAAKEVIPAIICKYPHKIIECF